MKEAEFEEKEFEGPLYQQLLAGSPYIFTPGQVFEGHFGIDAALTVQSPMFWSYFGQSLPRPGIVLDDYRWGFMWRPLGKRRVLPNFSVNALIQAKRPDVLEGKRGDFAAHGISGQYWRFFIREHQQQILERVSRVLSNRALVLYASPAFDKCDELNQHIGAGNIVDHSCFISVGRLTGHSSWNYDAPGTKGVAASKLESIEEPSLPERLSELLEHYDEGAKAGKELKQLHTTFVEVITELVKENGLARFILKRHAVLVDAVHDVNPKHTGETTAFLGLGLFCDILRVMWFPLGREAE